MNASVNISRFMERAESFGESLNSFLRAFLCVHRVSVVKNFRVEDHRDAMGTEEKPCGRASRGRANRLPH